MSPTEAKAALQPAFDDYLSALRMAEHSWEFKAEMCRKWRYVVQLSRTAGDQQTADTMVANNSMGAPGC
jgi:hypothetical protein